jgi:8-oxo-dGTP diphosphatase
MSSQLHDSDPNPPWTATNSAGYKAPAALAADVVVLTVSDGELRTLVVDTPDLPALPGGLVGPSENPLQTAHRKLHEKTGLSDLYLEQLETFAAPNRDPRGWIPSVAHLALVPASTHASDPNARWVPADAAPPLSYDHNTIVAAAVNRVRGKLWWSNIAVGIHPAEFTLADARHTYTAITGLDYDPSTFARDLRATGLIEPTGEQRAETRGRPAALFRYKERSMAWGEGRRKRVRVT